MPKVLSYPSQHARSPSQDPALRGKECCMLLRLFTFMDRKREGEDAAGSPRLLVFMAGTYIRRCRFSSTVGTHGREVYGGGCCRLSDCWYSSMGKNVRISTNFPNMGLLNFRILRQVAYHVSTAPQSGRKNWSLVRIPAKRGCFFKPSSIQHEAGLEMRFLVVLHHLATASGGVSQWADNQTVPITASP